MQLDQVRLEASAQLDPGKRAQLGQFMTPSRVARFMASLFSASHLHTARLLDAGAGVGSLSAAFLDRWAAGGFGFSQVDATAYEIDDSLQEHLARTLAAYAIRLDMNVQLLGRDFIEDAVNSFQFLSGPRFTHAILNPPYKKIGSHSRQRLLLRQVGLETVNLYTAFVGLTVELMEPGGQIVAIVPRSFCNGPYYKPFRQFLLERVAIRHMHLFASRDQAFKSDDVLQENVIVLLERGGQQHKVTISTSTDDSLADYETHDYPFERIVLPGDTERFIHIPVSPKLGLIELSHTIRYSLEDLGIEVSTGPVVDFRVSEFTRRMPEPGAVPLLYPVHFAHGSIEWPLLRSKKPNALVLNADTQKWLYPNGFYVVVRRFSSKEEKRRIVANVISPNAFDAPLLGIENHLNVFHRAKHGLPEDLVHGLAAFLNSTAIDEYFRRFSGHTQVNATDLRLIKYPSRDALIELGRWARESGALTQQQIDERVEGIR
jgi:tRNA1(Val) A37 N6-methylase TrmN6